MKNFIFKIQPACNTKFSTYSSPQRPQFNRAIWKDLESQIRKWARLNKDIYVVSGPIIKPGHSIIGNKVAVPQYYYKVIFDISPPSFKMIAFTLENKGSSQPLKTFVVTVDEVEKITGLDFFSELPDIIEDKLESEVNISSWLK